MSRGVKRGKGLRVARDSNDYTNFPVYISLLYRLLYLHH